MGYLRWRQYRERKLLHRHTLLPAFTSSVSRVCSKDDQCMRLPRPQCQAVLQYSGAGQRLTHFPEAWKSLIFNFLSPNGMILLAGGGLHMVQGGELLYDSRWSSLSKRNKCINWTVHRDEEILGLSKAQMELTGQPVTFRGYVSWVEILTGEMHVSFSSVFLLHILCSCLLNSSSSLCSRSACSDDFF